MAKHSDIAKVETGTLQPLEQIENLIHVIRGKQVMLDRDLARLYGVETFRLNEQVKRNIERFPEDFMFKLTREEAESSRSQFAMLNDDSISSQNPRTSNTSEILKSQIVTSSDNSSTSQIAILKGRGHNIKHLPYAFTENGVAMLSSVLRTPLAISTNIQIMRAFTASRHFWASNAQMFQRLEVIEHTQLSLAAHQEETDQKIEEVFRRLDNGEAKPTQGLFFNGQIYDSYAFVCGLVKSAKQRIVLIDNYIDETVLTLLDKRAADVPAKIYTKFFTKQLRLDIDRHNAQYAPIDVLPFQDAHDRFLCIDDEVYHFGASIKDLGQKWFAFNKMEITTDMLLKKM
jgi:hypothetical protein